MRQMDEIGARYTPYEYPKMSDRRLVETFIFGVAEHDLVEELKTRNLHDMALETLNMTKDWVFENFTGNLKD
jgi:hypothetical protein